MRTLELILIVVILVLLYASITLRTVTPKLSLQNDYFLLKEEAYSVARVLADSRMLTYLMAGPRPEDALKVVVTALVPPNREFRVKVVDAATGAEFVAETPHFRDCTLAATAVVVYSDSVHCKMYLVEVSLGRVTGG